MFIFRLLSTGLTQATLALLGKILCLKLLFIAIESGAFKDSAATFIKAGEITDRVRIGVLLHLGFSC